MIKIHINTNAEPLKHRCSVLNCTIPYDTDKVARLLMKVAVDIGLDGFRKNGTRVITEDGVIVGRIIITGENE